MLLHYKMDKAVTIIVGAGAVLDFEHKGIIPSVKNITEEVLKLPIRKVDGSEWLLINELYNHIFCRLKEVGNPDTRKFIHPQINFEDLLHVLEMCLTYSPCWHDEYLRWSSFPLFGSLTEPDSFLKSIDTVEFERAAYSLEKSVMEIVNQYDSAFMEKKNSEEWYRNYWRSIRRGNVFTLNYDTTIEESVVDYEDGFERKEGDDDYHRFSARNYSENPDGKTTIAHLHGSILFSEARTFPFEYSIRDLVKNKDYMTACKNRIAAQSTPRTQAKEEYIQPYIISGARKTEKMVYTPYNVYLSDLARKVLKNKRLMIIGYSFGDLYLNEILGLGMAAHGDDFKVVIIDKFPLGIDDYPSFLQHLLNSCNYGAFEFVSRLVKDRLYVEIGQKEFPLIVKDCDSPVVSRNGNLMMCIGGFKNAVLKQEEAIRRFLEV